MYRSTGFAGSNSYHQVGDLILRIDRIADRVSMQRFNVVAAEDVQRRRRPICATPKLPPRGLEPLLPA